MGPMQKTMTQKTTTKFWPSGITGAAIIEGRDRRFERFAETADENRLSEFSAVTAARPRG
jgi:hypothetical protein